MADRNGPDNNDESESPSIFDLFEPPPEPDPSTFGKVPVVRGDDDEFDRRSGTTAAERKTAAEAEAAGLQHWTAPATGQIPAVLANEKQGELWGDVKGPSWQNDDPTWSGPDLADVFAGSDDADLSEPEAAPPAQAAPSRSRSAELDDWGPDGRPTPPTVDTSEGRRIPGTEPIGGLDETEISLHRTVESAPVTEAFQRVDRVKESARMSRPAPGGDTAAARPMTEPARPRSVSSPPAVDESRRRSTLERTEALADIGSARLQHSAPLQAPPARDHQPPQRRSALSDDDPTAPELYGGSDAEDRYFDGEPDYGDLDDLDKPGGRNLPQAIGAGVVLGAVVLGALWVGPEAMMVLVAAAALIGTIELFNAMRLAGLRPATLLGLLGSVGLPVAAFFRGDAAFTVVAALGIVFGVLWYLAGADSERPVLNLSLTLFGVFWIGGLGAFAAMILRQEEFGVQLFLSTVVVAVVSDTMAFFGGRAFGRRPFHPASPNKTWEGTLTGFAFAVFSAFAMAVMPFSTMWDGRFLGALALGAVVGIMTPIGDLAESLVKRDLGVKDMGTILPGHGGILDRVDGILFALPGAYFLALLYGIF